MKWLKSKTMQGIGLAALTAILDYLQLVPGLSPPLALVIQMAGAAWASYGRKVAAGPL